MNRRHTVIFFTVSIAISAVFLIDGTFSRAVPSDLVADADQQDLLGYGFWFLWIPFSVAEAIALFLLARSAREPWKPIILSLCIAIFVASSLYSYAGYEALKARVTVQ